MLVSDILHDLRALNEVADALRRLSEEDPRRAALAARAAAIGRRLPTAIVDHHDRFARQNRPSLAVVRDGACGACGAPLAPAELQSLAGADRFIACPACSIFLRGEDPQEKEARP